MSNIFEFSPLWGVWKIEERLDSDGIYESYRISRSDSGSIIYGAVKHASLGQAELAQGLGEQLMVCVDTMCRLRGSYGIVSHEEHLVIDRKDGLGCDILVRIELLTGLPQLLKQCLLSQSETARLGADLCIALEGAARLGIHHGDIKPSNVYVTREAGFKLDGFGLNRPSGDKSFAAPEVYQGQPVTAASDVYSLGLVMYHMLNGGCAPFMSPGFGQKNGGSSDTALLRSLSGEAMPPPSEADKDMSDVILRACAYDPAKRFASAAELRNALLPFLHTFSRSAAEPAQAAPPIQPIHNNYTYTAPAAPQECKTTDTIRIAEPEEQKRVVWPWITGCAVICVAVAVMVILFVSGSDKTGVGPPPSPPIDLWEGSSATGSTASVNPSSTSPDTPDSEKPDDTKEPEKTEDSDKEYSFSAGEMELTATFSGEWLDAKPNGRGVLTVKAVKNAYSTELFKWEEGCSIETSWSAGRPGFTSLVKFAGGTYDGALASTLLPNGIGKFTVKENEIYEGEWKDGLRSGTGKMTYASGMTYDGQWAEDKPNGSGVLIGVDGSQYDGGFAAGVYAGQGTLTYSNGNSCSGVFEKGALNGDGTYMYADGGTYIGGIKSGVPHGKGILTYADGKKVNAEYHEGKLLSSAQIVDKVAAKSITLDTDKLELLAGEVYALSATISPHNTTDKDVSWSSDASDVAAVNQHGKVIALGAGSAVITATTSNGKTGVCYVHVTQKQVVYPNPESDFKFTVSSGGASITGYTGVGGNVVIPEKLDGHTVTAIKSSAFSSGVAQSVRIPSGVTSIDVWAFSRLPLLSSIDVSADNSAYKSVDGVLLTKNGAGLVQYPGGKSGESYSIPSAVSSIATGAFKGCATLSDIKIPTSVTSIAKDAFDKDDLIHASRNSTAYKYAEREGIACVTE